MQIADMIVVSDVPVHVAQLVVVPEQTVQTAPTSTYPEMHVVCTDAAVQVDAPVEHGVQLVVP